MATEIPASTQQPSVFITDATSGVGRAVVRAFVREGYRVIGTTDLGTVGATVIRSLGGIPVYPDLYRQSELKSLVQMARAELIIHLAPQRLNQVPQITGPYDSEGKLLDTVGSIVEIAGQLGVKRVIYPSFAYLYGDSGGEWVDEEAHLSQDETFLRHAQDAESAVLDGGIYGVVLRAGYVYDGQSVGLRALASAIRDGRPVAKGEGYANWIHAEDLASAILKAAQRPIADNVVAEVLNIVDDSPASPSAFTESLAQLMGLTSPSGLNFFARMAQPSMQKWLLAQSLRVSNARAKAALGWSPRYSAHAMGLEQVLLTWRAEDSVAV